MEPDVDQRRNRGPGPGLQPLPEQAWLRTVDAGAVISVAETSAHVDKHGQVWTGGGTGGDGGGGQVGNGQACVDVRPTLSERRRDAN